MKLVKALIITGYGINCEEEMAAAFRLNGESADIVHINRILSSEVSIHDYHIINFPGGFSFGDDIASGKVFANKIAYRRLATGKTLLEDIQSFLAEGKYIIGVCNGFQVLVRLGLLPNIAGKFEQEVTLMQNDSGRFIDNWCTVKANNTALPHLAGITEMDLPIRHGEGKLIVRDDFIRNEILRLKLNCLTYIGNPNGSELDCAGLCDPSGQVFGLMPHPEAFLSFYNHPDWNKKKILNPAHSEDGEGMQIFKNIIKEIKIKLIN